MRIRTSAACLVAALTIGGCNSEPNVEMENASVSEVANKVAEEGGDASFVRPGRWESKASLEEMTMPGMPPEAAEKMKGMAGMNQTHTSCLTAEQAKRPNEDFFAGVDKACRYERFAMGGGKIDAVLKCNREGQSQTLQMAGTYSDDAYSMVLNTSGGPAGPAQGMTMKMRVDAKRVGECDGTESKS